MNDPIIETAGYEDLAAILATAVECAGARRSPARHIDIDTIQLIRARDFTALEQLIHDERFRVYVARESAGKEPAGFALVALPFPHSVTGELQSELYEVCVLPAHRRRGVGSRLLARAERFVRSRGLDFLQTELSSANSSGLAFLHKRGFVQEMRVAVLKPVRPRARGYADVEVRFAAVYDIPYIRRLAVDALGDLCPSGRDVDRDMLREYTERTMKDSIEDRASGKEIVLVAGAPDSDAAGFLLARQEEDFFYGTTQLSVVNIVVRPSSRGLKVAGALFNRLLEIAIERGIEEITGTIAMSNRRSWLYFDKIWSAKEERKILVKKLRG